MRTVLTRIHSIILGYAVLYLPVMLLIPAARAVEHPTFVERTLNLLGFIWVLSLAYIPLALVFVRGFRETILRRVAGYSERDEREQLITERGARTAFLVMLAVNLALLILTVTNVQLIRYTGGHGQLAVGFGVIDAHLHPWSAAAGLTRTVTASETAVSTYLVPPNMASIFLVLILVQIGVFRAMTWKGYQGATSAGSDPAGR